MITPRRQKQKRLFLFFGLRRFVERCEQFKFYVKKEKVTVKIKKMTAFLLAAVMVAVCMPIVSAEGVSLQGAVICIEGREFDAAADSSGRGWTWSAKDALLTLNGYNGGRVELNATGAQGDVCFNVKVVGENVISNNELFGDKTDSKYSAFTCVFADIVISGGGSIEMSNSNELDDDSICMTFATETDENDKYIPKNATIDGVTLIMKGEKSKSNDHYVSDGIDSFGVNLSIKNAVLDFIDCYDCIYIDDENDVELFNTIVSAIGEAEGFKSVFYQGVDNFLSVKQSTIVLGEGLTHAFLAGGISFDHSVVTGGAKEVFIRSWSNININTSVLAIETDCSTTQDRWTPGVIFGHVYSDNSLITISAKGAIFTGARDLEVYKKTGNFAECAATVELKNSLVYFLSETPKTNNAEISFVFDNDYWLVVLDDEEKAEGLNDYSIANGSWQSLLVDSTNGYGDVDVSGVVNAADALLALQVAVGKTTLTVQGAVVLDVSGNGEVAAEDALLILQYAVGKITKFPIEDKIAKV